MTPHPPLEMDVPADIGYFGVLNDGRLISVYCEPGVLGADNMENENPEQRVFVRYSADGGRRWTDARHAFSYPPGKGLGVPRKHPVLVDAAGNVHVFSLRFYKSGWAKNDWHLAASDLFHNVSRDNGETWSAARRIDFGARYTGDLNSVLQMDNGRLLVPLSYLDVERNDGRFASVVVYSDDGGETWGISNSLMVHGGPYIESGAIEPYVVQFASGMLWMVIRTTTGYFWESFSNDGAVWTPPQRTRIVASNAPAGTTRLRDGRIVLFWNNLYGPPMKEGGASYARQILHGAISADEGQTWSAPKEIARQRPGDPPNTHIAYPYPWQLPDGAVLVLYHRANARPDRNWRNPFIHLVRVDPDWLAS